MASKISLRMLRGSATPDISMMMRSYSYPPVRRTEQGIMMRQCWVSCHCFDMAGIFQCPSQMTGEIENSEKQTTMVQCWLRIWRHDTDVSHLQELLDANEELAAGVAARTAILELDKLNSISPRCLDAGARPLPNQLGIDVDVGDVIHHDAHLNVGSRGQEHAAVFPSCARSHWVQRGKRKKGVGSGKSRRRLGSASRLLAELIAQITRHISIMCNLP
jgi:hypothetical protein